MFECDRSEYNDMAFPSFLLFILNDYIQDAIRNLWLDFCHSNLLPSVTQVNIEEQEGL